VIRIQNLQMLTSSSPLIIADNTVMFIFLTKNSKLRSELREILKNYEIKIQSLVKDPKKRHAITVFG
jgi:rRNA-processing protein FCF1